MSNETSNNTRPFKQTLLKQIQTSESAQTKKAANCEFAAFLGFIEN